MAGKVIIRNEKFTATLLNSQDMPVNWILNIYDYVLVPPSSLTRKLLCSV